MQLLLKYQQSFYKAIFKNDPKVLEEIIGPLEDFNERFVIYRDNVFVSFKEVLKDDFPVCKKILGDKKFNQAAFEFARNFPSTESCLFKYGKQFPTFLEMFCSTYLYIKDIAQLEWIQKKLYYCRDTQSLNKKEFEAIAPENYPRLKFQFHKATYFLKSSYALKEILAEAALEKPEFKGCSISREAYCLLIRPYHKVQLHWLQSNEFHFLEELYIGKTLGQAVESTLNNHSHFDLAAVLAKTLKGNFLTKVGEQI